MNVRRKLCWLFAIFALSAGVASAKECVGVSFPDQTQVGAENLSLNGLGLRLATMLKVKVYVAALYVAKTSTDPAVILGSSSPTKLVLQFVRDVGADDIRKGWDEDSKRTRKDSYPR